MEERIENIIKQYLKGTFKNEDALPSLITHGIAEEIYKHRWEIYSSVQEEYDMEDIETVADSLGTELTDEEKATALHRYKKIEGSNLDTLSYIIEEIIQEREKR